MGTEPVAWPPMSQVCCLALRPIRTYVASMKKMGGGIGFVILIITVLIVLVLSVRSWNSVLPVAKEALRPGATTAIPDHGQKGAGEAVRSGGLPRLQQMEQNTDQHIQQLKDTAKGQD